MAFPSSAPEPSTPQAASAKNKLRQTMRERLQNSRADAAEARFQAGEWLLSRPGIRTAAAFAAMAGEVDLMPLVCSHPQVRWVFPRIHHQEIILHQVPRPPAGLRPGAYGILEPAESLPIVPADQVDVFFCPGLGFDPQGGRLGRGKGFYDRLLAAARPDAFKIGVGFACQLVENTFPETHDIPMDRIICAG